ncbi:MAG TPA: caspase family protein [Bradyrhizobium sp.]
MFGLALTILFIANSGLATAEERIALVVGNSAYLKVPPLANPVNDAADMAASLQRLGFTVKHTDNLDYKEFRLALIDFGNAAKTADKAVIFYAGHGVEIDGKNWLIPVDAEIKSELDVYAEAINLETLIDISVMPKLIGLVILDACRNDPFAASNAAASRSLSKNAKDSGKSSKSAAKKPAEPANPTEPAARGLVPVEVNDNVLVAFAAAAGTTANDGAGRNSPYSGSLLRHVETPGLEINYVFRNVHDDVVHETKTQEPAVYGTLSSEEIYLKGDAAVAAANAEAEAERVAWTFVRSTSEIATLRRFAQQFPASTHVLEVNDRIAQLESAEKFAWTIVQKQNSTAAYRAFLELYPYSDNVEGARVTLASLEAQPGRKKSDAGGVDLPKPPASTYQLASASPEATTKDPDSVEKAWDVLKDSRDKNVVGSFAQKYPSQRNNRIPGNSDVGLRRVNPTELMLRTAQDNEVNLCFSGDATSCVAASGKYPDLIQLRFQLCRLKGHPKGCMQDAVNDARKRGLLVSAYTKSEKEKARNREYRQTVARVQQNVSNVVSNVVSTTVSNVVNQAVSNAVSQAASNAASAAAGNAASRAAAAAASNAAGRAASTAASNAAGRAASSAASNAASKAASSAASRAASSAASNAASRIPSDIRLKQDVHQLGVTERGLRLYRYRYIGDDTIYVGVMAQEVAQRVPAAVSRGDDGYLQVDYRLLGLDFLTWRDWTLRHSARTEDAP